MDTNSKPTKRQVELMAEVLSITLKVMELNHDKGVSRNVRSEDMDVVLSTLTTYEEQGLSGLARTFAEQMAKDLLANVETDDLIIGMTVFADLFYQHLNTEA
jgi:hypothetical protein